MASIQMNMGTETEINATPNKDGLILFDTTNKKIILNNNGTREVLTKHIEANPNLNGAEQLENLKVNGEVLNFLPVDISNVEKDGEAISDILEDKYNTEGDYNTTVDKCTDLTRVSPVTDTAPYIYRQTPVKESFKALMKKIVGASVVWNQLISNPTTKLSFTTSSTSPQDAQQNLPFIANHKYLLSYFQSATLTSNTRNTAKFYDGENHYQNPSTNANLSSGRKNWVFVPENSTSSGSIGIWCHTPSSDCDFDKFNVYDLTAMFGTTIADYVYTLEQATAERGIAWLQSYGFFTEDYYAYKQNKLESGCVSAHKTYDGETLLTNTELSPITLRGLFKLSTDKLTVDGDEYNADGSVNRKFGVVDLGSLDWNYDSSAPRFMVGYSSAKPVSANSVIGNLLCEKYTTISLNDVYGENTNKAIAISTGSYISIVDKDYTNPQIFKTAMSGVYLIYELATPTTEQTTPFTETEIVGSTEEFIDYEVAQSNRDVAIPVGTETDYYQSYDVPPIPFTSCYLCASNQKLNWVSN